LDKINGGKEIGHRHRNHACGVVQKMIGMAEFTDISGIFANSAEMVAECKGTVYGYLRVSTAAQKHDRQMDAMKELGVKKENMFFDKQSGKDFNRPGYRKLLAKLRENDLLVIKNIDRLGRNTKEVKEQWRIITQEKHVSIVVVDTPVLNAGKELGPLGQALSDIIFAIFSMVADFDRQSICQRLQEGLRVARRERGIRPGRKAMEIPESFGKLKEAYEKGEISQRSAARQLGVDRKTFRKWLGRTEIAKTGETKKQGARGVTEGQEGAFISNGLMGNDFLDNDSAGNHFRGADSTGESFEGNDCPDTNSVADNPTKKRFSDNDSTDNNLDNKYKEKLFVKVGIGMEKQENKKGGREKKEMPRLLPVYARERQ